MNPQQQQEIRALLTEARALISNPISPHDYATLKQAVLEQELTQEIDALSALLDNPDEFSTNFKQRCKWRAHNPNHAVAIGDAPASFTQHLYWKIAEKLFAPQSMREMLGILAPNITKVLEITLEQPLIIKSFGHRTQKAEKMLEPKLSVHHNLAPLSDVPAQYDLLSQYVMVDSELLAVQEFAEYPLVFHSKNQLLLDSQRPKIHKALYQHNADYRKLYQDIKILQQNGTSPREAISRLITALNFGGSRMTGSEYANVGAEKARKRFIKYFMKLPEQTRTALRALRADTKSLGDIFDNEIERGQCVETTARYLVDILSRNPDSADLNIAPGLTPDELKTLKNKYKDAPLSSIKDSTFIPNLPSHLTSVAFSRCQIKTTETLIDLLISFSPSQYDLIFQTITLENPEKQLQLLLSATASSILNQEQKAELYPAILKYLHRFNLNKPVLDWVLSTSNAEILQLVLSKMHESQRLGALYNANILDLASTQSLYLAIPSIADVIFNSLNDADARQLIRSVNKYQNTVFLELATDPSLLARMLAYFPESERRTLLDFKNAFNTTAFQKAATNPEALRIALSYYLPHEIHRHLEIPNDEKRTAIHNATVSLPALTYILSLYPEAERANAIDRAEAHGVSLLKISGDNIEINNYIFSFYSQDKRNREVGRINEQGQSILHTFANKPETLRYFLSLLSTDTAFTLMSHQDSSNKNALYYALSFPKSIELLMPIVPDNKRLELFNSVIDDLRDPHRNFGFVLDSLQILLHALPVTDRLSAIVPSNALSLTHHFAHNSEALIAVLESLSNSERLTALSTLNADGNTVLHAQFPLITSRTICSALSTLSADDRITALEKVDRLGHNVLFYLDDHAFVEVCALLPISHRMRAVQHLLIPGSRTVLHQSANQLNDPAIKILELIPESERLAALQLQGNNGDSLLHYLIYCRNVDVIAKVFDLLPAADRLTAIKIMNPSKQTILKHLLDSSSAFAMILNHIPSDQLLPLITALDTKNLTILDLAASNAEVLQLILNKLPEKDIAAIAQHQNEYGTTLLARVAMEGHLALQVLLTRLFPSDASKNNFAVNDIFALAILCNPKCLQTLFQFLPKEKQLALLNHQNENGYTLLMFTMYNRDSLSFLLSCYANEKIAAIEKGNNKGQNCLHLATFMVPTFENVLTLYPPERRLTAILKTDNENNSAFSMIINAQLVSHNDRMIVTMVRAIPESDRIELLKTKVNGIAFIDHLLNRGFHRINNWHEILPESCLSNILEIGQIINNQPASDPSFFNQAPVRITLAELLENSSSYTDIQTKIKQLIENQPNAALCKALEKFVVDAPAVSLTAVAEKK